MSTVTQTSLDDGAKNCQPEKHCGIWTLVNKNHEHESEAQVEKFEVIHDGSQSIVVIDKETSPAEIFDKAAAVPVENRRQIERVSKKPEAFAYFTSIHEGNSARDDAEITEDEQDVSVLNDKAALVIASLGDDALPHICLRKNSSNYPEPVDDKKAIDSPEK